VGCRLEVDMVITDTVAVPVGCLHAPSTYAPYLLQYILQQCLE
jgi:hypothetical protein